MFSRALARHSTRCLVNDLRIGSLASTTSVSVGRHRRFRSTEASATTSTPAESSASASSSTSTSPSPNPISQTPSSSPSKGTENETLPYLPRPLGVPEPPTTFRTSWRDETMELMDQDVRLARRKHIIREASKGYFHDLNATRKHGGKTWIAPPTLTREDHALYFPDIAGTRLEDRETVHTTDLCKGKVSVVAMLSSAISEEHVDSFVSSTNSLFLSHPHYRFIQINLQENPAKAFLVSLYLSSLRRRLPKYLHPFYLLSKQNMEYLREPMGMNNKHVGFVYLVDEKVRVRWAGGGLATEGERESLKRCVRVLVERMEKEKGTGTGAGNGSGSGEGK